MNTYGIIATLFPADSNEHELYACPVATQVIATLTICNRAATSGTFQVGFTESSGAINNSEYVFYNKEIPANDTIQITVRLQNPNTIRVQMTGTINFLLEGLVIT